MSKGICRRALDTSKPVHESLHRSQISRRKKPNKSYFPLQIVKSHFHFSIILRISTVGKKNKPWKYFLSLISFMSVGDIHLQTARSCLLDLDATQ